MRNAKEVSLTGELKTVKEVSTIEGAPRPEKKSLLKRKNPSEAENVAVVTVSPVTAEIEEIVAPQVPTVTASVPINTPQSEPINLISDDDDFEVLPSKPKKPTLLSCKKTS